jgi:hypothetical protein
MATCLFAKCQPFGEAFRQSGRANLRLSRGDIVIQAAQLDSAFFHVVDDVATLGISIARLTDTADVYKVFFSRLNPELRVGAAAHGTVADKCDGNMRVTKETDARVLVGEAGRSSELVKDIAPTFRPTENGSS